MKYARVERERRFLLAGVPDDAHSPAWITDHYLLGLRMRLRCIAHADGSRQYKLGQKHTPDAAQPRRRHMTTLYLSADEYAVTQRRLAGGVVPLRKRRSQWSPDGLAWVVDAFEQPEGVVIAEVECDDDAALAAVPPPPGTVREITGEPALEGSALAAALQPTLSSGPVKQVIVYRRDLKMRKGKIAAQCAHASLAVFLRQGTLSPSELVVPLDPAMAAWVRGRFTKVVLAVDTEAALVAVHEAALAAGLPTALITDSGRTEFRGVPTRTTVAVGPALVEAVDRITGPSGLVRTRLA